MGKMVPATEFKAKCLALIDEMARSGEPLTITRRGKRPLTLTASSAEKARDPFGCMKGTAVIVGDLDEPIDPDWEVKWETKWDERGYPVRPDDTSR